ncbi:MAG: winged helix-turn-helix domain-containing protein [Desulfurococcales archaeon]|nr:winged helix-turn-helix domain-containing protein [Desulfurococcales archaeon]
MDNLSDIDKRLDAVHQEYNSMPWEAGKSANGWLRGLICTRGSGYSGPELFLMDIITVYSDDLKMRILIFLSHSSEPSSIRKIARNLKCTHKSVIRHLEILKELGLVSEYYSQSNLKLYLLSDRLKDVRRILEKFDY